MLNTGGSSSRRTSVVCCKAILSCFSECCLLGSCLQQVVVNLNTAGDGIHFRRAGPRDKVLSLSLS
jgi:hypothetical protein